MPKDLSQMQADDSEIAPVLEWKLNGRRPAGCEVAARGQLVKSLWAMWDCLELKEGVLYRKWESPSGGGVVWQLIAPKALR